MISLSTITRKENRNSLGTLALAAFATFTTYFCMYGFRKAISAAAFDGITAFGISFKSALIIAQVLGYMTAKFIGIRFISELDPANRSVYILWLIGGAHGCLLFLALVPTPFNVLFLYVNGLCLGLIWGLVFSFIEGRKYTDIIALVLSINFIFSSGIVKSIGRTSIESWHIQEIFMPFFTGCLFLPVLFYAVHLLKKIPPPLPSEIQQRGQRPKLTAAARKALIKEFFPGLAALIFINLLLTILRDIKDNYAVEIIRSVQPGASPSIYARMETIAALLVFALLLTISGMNNHFKSLKRQHVMIAAGFVTILACGLALHYHSGDAIALLVTFTIGLYISYNTIQCLFLERFIASFKVKGNIGFFFYMMDSIGYLGSCFLILNKELFNNHTDWLPYFIQVSIFSGIAGLLSVMGSWLYFSKKYLQIEINDNQLP
jgi:hypothetical protein